MNREECVRRVVWCGLASLPEVADMLAPVIQTLVLQQQQLMAASLGPGHAQAVARAGTLKTSTFAFYILLDEEERT